MDSEAAAAASASMEGEEKEEETPVRKHELVRQLQFPPGFRFVPTEGELVDIYLRDKIEGRKPPLDVINEVILLEWQPGSLVETYKAYGEEKWYFFAKRERSSSNKEEEPDRKVKVPGVTATWKATGSLVMIYNKGKPRDVVVGTKRVLIYHSSDAQEDGKWSMHEYVLKGNSQIGQYALYSIQRKQHSDTEHKTGRNSKHKTGTINKEPGKTAKRKKGASAQQQKQETTPQHAPPPLTPPNQDHQKPQQESPPSAYALTNLRPLVPLQQQQGYPSDGNQQYLEVSAPMSVGHAQACCYDDLQFADMNAQFNMQIQPMLCNQGEQPRSLICSQSMLSNSNVDGARYQPYQMVPNQLVYTGQYGDFFPRYTTQNSSKWELGQDQLYQQMNENAIGLQNPYGFQSYYVQQGHDAMFGRQEIVDYGSQHDQFPMSVDGDASASRGGDNVASFPADDCFSDLDPFVCNDVYLDDVPMAAICGEQYGSNPAALQSQQDLQRMYGQQQQNDNGAGSTF